MALPVIAAESSGTAFRSRDYRFGGLLVLVLVLLLFVPVESLFIWFVLSLFDLIGPTELPVPLPFGVICVPAPSPVPSGAEFVESVRVLLDEAGVPLVPCTSPPCESTCMPVAVSGFVDTLPLLVLVVLLFCDAELSGVAFWLAPVSGVVELVMPGFIPEFFMRLESVVPALPAGLFRIELSLDMPLVDVLPLVELPVTEPLELSLTDPVDESLIAPREVSVAVGRMRP